VTREKLAYTMAKTAGLMFEASPEDVLSVDRSRSFAEARGLALWLTRRLYGFSYPELGRMFRLDHTTVMHHVKKIERALIDDPRSRIARYARMLTRPEAAE
jgi:chromosomal replication initiation ATPase DnaA